MNVLSRTLERVRETLLGRRIPGRHARPAVPSVAPHEPATRPAPNVLGARLVVVRKHRKERHAGPVPALPGALIRPYVANLGVTPRNARTGTQGGPWGNAQ